MELIELNAKQREATGKGAARKLRSNKAFPGIVYGKKIDPVMISLDTPGFNRVIREHGTTGLFFKLKIEDDSKKERVVMLKELQMDTFGLEYVHIDLHEIDMDTLVTVTVPVETIGGEPVGVKEGGLLQIIRRELDVLCKPANTPDSIQIDVSALDIGDAIHVSDIDMGEDVEIPHDVDFTVITVVPPSLEEEEDEEDEDLLDEELAEEGSTEEEPAAE